MAQGTSNRPTIGVGNLDRGYVELLAFAGGTPVRGSEEPRPSVVTPFLEPAVHVVRVSRCAAARTIDWTMALDVVFDAVDAFLTIVGETRWRGRRSH